MGQKIYSLLLLILLVTGCGCSSKNHNYDTQETMCELFTLYNEIVNHGHCKKCNIMITKDERDDYNGLCPNCYKEKEYLRKFR